MMKDEALSITTVETSEPNLKTQMDRLPGNLMPNSDKLLANPDKGLAAWDWRFGIGQASLSGQMPTARGSPIQE